MAYLFIAPLVLLLFGLIAYPLISALVLSFYNVSAMRNRGFVGLVNYQRLWLDPQFRSAIWNTVTFATVSVFWQFWIGLGAALLLHRKGLRLRSILTGLVLLPWIVPEVVVAMTWRGLYDPVFGGFNMVLLRLGLIDQGIVWLSYATAMPAVIAVNVWKGIPFMTILLLAGLKAIDAELYDAAAVDGATGWQRFLNVTLPGLRYVIVVACLLSAIWTLNAFGLIYLLTGGGPGSSTLIFSILAYRYAIPQLRYSVGVAASMSVVPALLVLIAILSHYLRSEQPGGTTSDTGLLARIARALSWPFLLPFRLVLVVMAGLSWLVERALDVITAASRWAYLRGDPRREGAYHLLLRRIGDGLTYAAIGLLLCFLLFPFYWLVITAFKTEAQARAFQSVLWPSPWTTEHFAFMLTRTAFPTWFANTVKVVLVSTTISVLVSALGAYGLVRLRWRGAGFLSTAILFAYLMPTVMLLVPLYRIFTELRLIDTLGSLMLAYPTFGLPFATWLLMGYYRSIPRELEEAALIDGANHFQAFFRIIMPLTLPALLAVALFGITTAWNEFLYAFVFITPESARTLPVGLSSMIIGDIFPYGKMFAASVMMTVPVAIIYMLAQRFMVEGLTAGAVKG